MGRTWMACMLAGALLVGGAGCERAAEEAPTPPAAATQAATPLSFSNQSDAVEVSLTLPAELRTQPALHARLYEEDVAALSNFSEGAVAERRDGPADAPPWSMQIQWAAPGQTARLLSLMREESSFTGGLHPNTSYRALIWDKAEGRAVSNTDLFPASQHERLRREMCERLEAEKADRGANMEGYTCPAFADVQLALEGPPGGGLATGVTVVFAPSEVGAYAESSYEVTLPASVVRDAAAPAWREQFGP